DALEASGRAEDTLVVFTSDHGYLLGQHGRFEKHCCYEPALRSALLMSGPGLGAGRAVDAQVQLHDLAPTLLELCGVPLPDGLHGRSLGPLLRGATGSHRDVLFFEYSDNEEGAVRTDRWKLIYGTGRRRRRDGYALPGPLP